MPYRIRPVTALAMAGSLWLSAPLAHAQTLQSGPLPPAIGVQSQPVKDRYIVVFRKDIANPQAEAAAIVRGIGGGRVHRTYDKAIKGFSVTLPAQALEGVRRNPNVAYIEQDMTVSVNQSTGLQNQAPWGLDRIDQADRPLDTQYRFKHTGQGVYAFILDTGIRLDHEEFKGRMASGADFIDEPNAMTQPGNDCHGHGTHVAGTVGGSTWGVAKQVRLVPVRVLGCGGFGSLSSVLAGIDWVAANPRRPAVATMSLEAPMSAAVNEAVEALARMGVTAVAAAGNGNTDACGVSPASAPSAITVGATTTSDQRASYSNFGSCVDVFAPGSGITSASHLSPTATSVRSGTSMAAPHVAGVAALMLQQNPAATPAQVSDALVKGASENRLSELNTGSPNRLVYSLASLAPVAPPPAVVAISDLRSSTTKYRNNWQAMALVTVSNMSGTGAPIARAVVTGIFTPGRQVSCTTDDMGKCHMPSELLQNKQSAISFEITGITREGMVYSPDLNRGTKLLIAKP